MASEVQPTTRREFIHRGVGLIGFGATAPAFLVESVRAMTNATMMSPVASRAGAASERILVVVQMAGGNDGLNTVIPYRDDEYYRLRPTLAIPRQAAIALTDELGLHPEAAGFKQLWDQGMLGVVQGVGYPNPNRSHFVGTRIWETAVPDGRMAHGWLGRYFDNTCKGNDVPDPTSGIALVDEVPIAMRGERFMPISTARPEQFGLIRGGPAGGGPISGKKQGGANNRRGRGGNQGRNSRRAPKMNGPKPPSTPAPGAAGNLDFLRRSTLNAQAAATQVRAAARMEIDGADFPRTALARSLKSVARMIAAGMPTKVYYVSQTGFDTHANQLPRHARLMKESGAALIAFLDALRRTGNLSRTLVMTFSEFGRRAAENASKGTDHGQAAPMFVIGDVVKGGVIGSAPKLNDLNDGDVRFDIDFRQVYATILRDWFAANPDSLLRGKWDSLPLLKT